MGNPRTPRIFRERQTRRRPADSQPATQQAACLRYVGRGFAALFSSCPSGRPDPRLRRRGQTCHHRFWIAGRGFFSRFTFGTTSPFMAGLPVTIQPRAALRTALVVQSPDPREATACACQAVATRRRHPDSKGSACLIAAAVTVVSASSVLVSFSVFGPLAAAGSIARRGLQIQRHEAQQFVVGHFGEQ